MSNPTIAFQSYLKDTREYDEQKKLREQGIESIPAELESQYNTPTPQDPNLYDTIPRSMVGTPLSKSKLPANIDELLQAPSDEVFESPKFKNGKYSLSDLEKDPEFMMRTERFMEEIGSNEEIFEYLRDPEFSISAAFQRSIDIGKWSDQAKEDYVWLEDVFSNAELSGFRETMGMVKDLGVDLLTDPVNWVAALFAAPSIGLSLGARAALTKATKEGLRKISKASVKRLGKVAKGRALGASAQTAKYGAAEGAAFAGPHDYFLQDAEKELGLRENIDLTQTAMVAGIGSALGGILGGSIGAYTAYSPMLRTKLYNYANEGAIIEEAASTSRQAEFDQWGLDHFLAVNRADSQSPIIKLGSSGYIDKEMLETVGDDVQGWYNRAKQRATEQIAKREKKKAKKSGKKVVPSKELGFAQYWSKRALLGYYGKSTSILASAAENSPELQRFLGKLRYDWNHTLTKGVQKVQDYTYEEFVSGQQSSWKVMLEDTLQPLLRATFKDGENFKGRVANLFNDKLDYDQNEQLLRLIWDPEAVEITYKSPDGDLIRLSRAEISPEIIEAAKGIKNLTNSIRTEAIQAGLLTKYQFIKNYFPRQFQHDKIIAEKDRFINIIANSEHAAPVNAYASNKYSIANEYLTPKGYLSNDLKRILKENNINNSRVKGWDEVTENNITLNEIEDIYRLGVSKKNYFVSRLNKDKGGIWVDQDYFGRNFLREALQKKQMKADDYIEITDVGGEVLKDLDWEQEVAVLETARKLKATAIVDNMLQKKQVEFLDTAYLEAINFNTTLTQGSFKNRVFDQIPDQTFYAKDGTILIEGFEDFIDRDVNRVLSNYLIGSSRTIQRARMFGKSESVFQNRTLATIEKELREAGVSEEEMTETLKRTKLLYKRTTGLDVPTWEDVVNDPRLGKGITSVTDWAKISQQLAHLPLATLSSITEPLILLSRIDNPNVISREGYQTARDIVTAMTKGVRKDLDRWSRAIGKLRGKKTYGLKDIADDEWRELYQTGLALEQSVMQRLEGLYGEAPRGAFARGVQNSFFHINLLTQWTGAVQLAAYTTGKRLIRQNSEKLYKHNAGIQKLSKEEFIRSRDRLWEAGISTKKGVNWYKNSLDENGNFDESLAQGMRGSKPLQKAQKGFYYNFYQRGAARFAKEIILVPTTAAANRPLWHSHPAGQLLAQFSGYPTAFNNTILKRFAREVYTDIKGLPERKTMHATPKIVAATVMMTSVATLMNAIRSQGDSLEGDPGDIIMKSIQRWGGMGPLEVAYRYKVNAGYGSGQMGSLLKAPAGPLAQDVVDMVLYRKGFAEMGMNNLPFSAAFQMIGGDAYKDRLTKAGRRFDKATWGSAFGPTKKSKDKSTVRKYYGFAIGGEVNIPNAKEEPDEKIDRMTGLPYNQQAGVLGQDEEERFGFAIGGLPRALRSTIGLAKNKRGTAFRTRWQDEDNLRIVDERRLKRLQKEGESLAIVTMQTARELLEDGQITIKEARALLREAGYKKQSIYKFIRTYKDAGYAKGDDFVTYRSSFVEGGPVDDEEALSYLTKASRLAAPYLDDGEPLRIYTKEEIKGYPKGITQTVYRDLKEGTEIENLNDFEFTDKVGIPVHTVANEHQAGKVRIYNPLDLRKKDIEDFTGSEFMEELIDDEILQNIIVKHSKLPKAEARERIKDLIAEYQFAVTELGKLSLGDEDRIEYALNIKVGKEAKDIINELGYDSILYNKEGQTAVMLFEPGQFRAIESSNPSKPVREKQMDDLGFEREGYAEGGLFGGFFKRRRARRMDRVERGLDRGEWSGPLARLLKTRVGKKMQSLLPERFKGTNARWAMLDIIGDTADRTAKDLSKIENEVLKTHSIAQIKAGQNTIGYDDFKTGHTTSPVGSLVGYTNIGIANPRKVAKEIDELRSTAEGDARYNLSTTLGGAMIERDADGVYWIKDRYNFNRLTENEGEVKSALLAAYAAWNRDVEEDKGYGFQRALMGSIGSEEGEGSYVNIRLGTADELGLRGNQDSRWTRKHGDKRWKSDVKHGHGTFAGFDKTSMEADLAKLGAAHGKTGQASAQQMKKALSSFPEYSNIEVKEPGIKVVKPKQPPSLLTPKKDTGDDFYSMWSDSMLGRQQKAGGGKLISLLARRGTKLSAKHRKKLQEIQDKDKPKYIIKDSSGEELEITSELENALREYDKIDEQFRQNQTERLSKLSPLDLKRRNKLIDDYWEAQEKLTDAHIAEDKFLKRRFKKERDGYADELKERYGEDHRGVHPSDEEGLDF